MDFDLNAALNDYRRCQKFCVLRWVKKSHLMAQVNRSPNRIAN